MNPERRTRSIPLRLERGDPSSRSFPASLSSEKPVLRWGFVEVLDHKPESIDLSRARGGVLPLLSSHDPTEIPRAGNVERVHLAGKRLKGVLRFASHLRADELLAAVNDGVLDSISISYDILKTEQQGTDKETGLPIIRVTRWRPLEVSLVNVPADESVGVGRSLEGESRIMEKQPNVAPAPAVAPDAMSSVPDERSQRQRENLLLKHGNRIAAMYPQLAGRILQRTRELVEQRGTAEQLGQDIIRMWDEGSPSTQIRPASGPECHLDGLGIPSHEMSRYSVLDGLGALVDPSSRRGGFERAVSEEIQKRRGSRVDGLTIPWEALTRRRAQRDQTASTGSLGGFSVPTQILPIVDVLRNSARVVQAGATVMMIENGNVSIPRKTAGSTAYWVAENADVTESGVTLGQINLAFHTVGGFVDISRQLMLTSSLDWNDLVSRDLTDTIGVAIDKVALVGGGAAEPIGILGYNGTPALALVDFGANGAGTVTWGKMLEFIKDLGVSNALGGRPAFISTAAVQAKALAVEKVATTGLFVLEPPPPGSGADGQIAGYLFFASNNVPSNYTEGTHSTPDLSACIFANWEDLLIAFWGGGIDVMVDPYTGFKAGTVRIRALAHADVAMRRFESFAIAKDINTA